MAAAAEEFVDNTIAGLKVLGMVPKNGKLCVRKGQLALDAPNKLQAVRRWAHGDSRDITIMHVRNTINSAVKISKSLMDDGALLPLALWTLDRMASEMEQCEMGLQNLMTTYASDAAMVAALDVLTDRLRAHSCEVRACLDERLSGPASPPSSGASEEDAVLGAQHARRAPADEGAPPQPALPAASAAAPHRHRGGAEGGRAPGDITSTLLLSGPWWQRRAFVAKPSPKVPLPKKRPAQAPQIGVSRHALGSGPGRIGDERPGPWKRKPTDGDDDDGGQPEAEPEPQKKDDA